MPKYSKHSNDVGIEEEEKNDITISTQIIVYIMCVCFLVRNRVW